MMSDRNIDKGIEAFGIEQGDVKLFIEVQTTLDKHMCQTCAVACVKKGHNTRARCLLSVI